MTVTQVRCLARVGTQVVEPTAVELTIDEGWSPYAQATFTVPYDPATVDALDPRALGRVELTIEHRFSGSRTAAAVTAAWAGRAASWVTTTYAGARASGWSALWGVPWSAVGVRASTERRADLGIRSRAIDHKAATVTLKLASDEARLQDYALLQTSSVLPSGLTVLAAVQMVLDRVLPGYVLVTSQGAQTISAESAVWSPGQSGWDFLSPLVASAGLRLWCDELRTWHLDDPVALTVPGQVTLSGAVNVTGATDTIDRDSSLWCDGVVVKYGWTDTSNVAHVVYDVAGEDASLVQLVQRTTPWPRAGEAAHRLRKMTSAGRVLDVNALVDLRATPSMAASLSIEGTPTQTGTVSAVTWRVPDDEMTVKTRGLLDTPPTAWAAGPAGETWASIPAGVPWTDMDWSW